MDEESGILDILSGFFDVRAIIDNLPALLHGLLLTLELTALSLAAGLLLAVPLAMARASRNRLLWMPSYAYIFVFRGSPLLVQLYLTYYGLGQFTAIQDSVLWPILREPFWCAIIAFTLNTTAYTAEILRGAIQAVPFGEVEAAKSVGMSRTLTYRRIIVPRAFRIALPAYSNEVILMLQASSIASLVTLTDLTGTAKNIIAETFATYELYLTAALFYLALTYGIAWLFKRLEYRLSGHLRDRPAAAAPARHAAGAALPSGR